MNSQILLNISISLGLAFGIYGVVVQRGANLVRVDGKAVLMAAIWGLLELAAALAGYGGGSLLLRFEMARERDVFWIHVLAGFLFAAIGIRMLIRAFREKTFLEHRMENVDIREDVLLSLRLCVHGFFAGIACGLLELKLLPLLGIVFVITAAFAVAGYISGRAWGPAPSGKACAIGGGILCLLGIVLQVLN